MFEQKSFDLLLISFVFYLPNSPEKQFEKSGVLLNCILISDRFFTSADFVLKAEYKDFGGKWKMGTLATIFFNSKNQIF